MRNFSGIQFPLSVTKMSGTGNDFLLIDHRNAAVPVELMPEVARLVCRRKFSAGADGLIFIENSDTVDFAWRFYNADGSEAEMCGNGARCAARFAFKNKIAGSTMRFDTIAGIIEAEMVGDDVKVKLTPPFGLEQHQKVDMENQEVVLQSINTGVPHAVNFVDDIAEAKVCEWGSLIRHHDIFKPAGTNN